MFIHNRQEIYYGLKFKIHMELKVHSRELPGKTMAVKVTSHVSDTGTAFKISRFISKSSEKRVTGVNLY